MYINIGCLKTSYVFTSISNISLVIQALKCMHALLLKYLNIVARLDNP